MGKIIQKDFFPDLEKIKTQIEYLDAVEKNDVIKLREIYAKYSGRKPANRLGCKYDESARAISMRKDYLINHTVPHLCLLVFSTAESPATFETPVRNVPSPRSTFSTPTASTSHEQINTSDTASVSSRQSRKNPSAGHSLDSFLSSYTSEDNCSFQELMDKSDKKLRQKFAVLYEAEEETALRVAQNLCLPSIEDQFKEICGPKTVSLTYYSQFSRR